jgi:tetratricopeptide (TPR) repeat protein
MNEEAEPLYRQAIKAQGNMEAAFNANHRFADFLLRKAAAELAGNDVASAITSLEIAARHMDRALALSLGWSMGLEGYFLKVRIHSALGQAFEAAGDPHRAIKQYDYIAGLNKGESGNYLAAIMLSKQALIAWTERGSEEDALRLFIEADQRIKKARLLPAGVTPENLNEHVEFIRGNIRYLQESNVKASDTLNF